MISARFAAPVAALVALALIPTVIHSYVGVRVVDGRIAAAIPDVLAGGPSAPVARRPGWARDRFDTDDWIERVYRVEGQEVTLFVARSYDAKRLYHHPELALLRDMESTPVGIIRPSARPDVPLHVLTTSRDGRRGLAVYALLYDGRFVDNPVLFQLRTATELLISGRKSMTLVFASAPDSRPAAVDEAQATRVVLDAIARFEEQPSRAGR